MLCTLFVAIWSQMAQLYNETPELSRCTALVFKTYEHIPLQCMMYNNFIDKQWLNSVGEGGEGQRSLHKKKKITKQKVCFTLDACTDTDGMSRYCCWLCLDSNNKSTMCRLFPMNTPLEKLKKEKETRHATKVAWFRSKLQSVLGDEPNICNLAGVKELCNVLSQWGNDHLPVDDLDGDWFSQIPEMRGSYWRGKDCKDDDPAFHPGIKNDPKKTSFKL
ncbi:hypothetical protein RFI_24230 [Reticulomyxa filosa]|uniref:Uncharacterized protein n=1 Tax=Reticulomyxa filosa TaxID=46433 RepID=X6MHI4_RETFI|nr:hypothetical protein RFI_24230 [Reticulomyxa filosa]|eukprot:ETO13141.1 hypothetical protein RFI_24230 [Reticulomyxa filosa]